MGNHEGELNRCSAADIAEKAEGRREVFLRQAHSMEDVGIRKGYLEHVGIPYDEYEQWAEQQPGNGAPADETDEDEDPLEAPLCDLLPTRTANALDKRGISTVRDLEGQPDAVLLQISQIGTKAITDINNALRTKLSLERQPDGTINRSPDQPGNGEGSPS